MQKLLTVAIDIEKLKESTKGPFTVTDIAGINALLHEGWMIQEWEFITGEDEEEKAIVMMILNDEMSDNEFDISSYSEEKDPGEDEDDSENDLEQFFEKDPDKTNEFEEEDDVAEDAPVRKTYSQY